MLPSRLAMAVLDETSADDQTLFSFAFHPLLSSPEAGLPLEIIVRRSKVNAKESSFKQGGE